MKKLFAIAAMLLMVIGATAQENKLSIKAGVGLSTVTGDIEDAKTKFAYKVGVGYEFGITESFAIEPALMFSAKGAGELDLYYLEVPIMAVGHFNKLTVNAGPYIGYGIAGTDSYFDLEGAKRFEAGLGAGLKYNFDKFIVGVDCTYGLTSIVEDFSCKNLAFGLTLGYSF